MTGSALPLYDNIGTRYDTTRRADPFIADRLAHLLGLQGSGNYVDLACGPVNYTTALARRGGHWHGLDQSDRMLRVARRKSRAIAWCQADVAAQPFRDGVFSGAVITCAVHHFGSLGTVVSEMARVITRGRIVILTAAPAQMRGYWLCEYFPDAMDKSVEQMPGLEEIDAALTAAGFRVSYTKPYEIQSDLGDFFLYSGKHRPEGSLHPSVRQGISTFASLADPAEVTAGCERLRQDIASGRITEVTGVYARAGRLPVCRRNPGTVLVSDNTLGNLLYGDRWCSPILTN